ncbi:hydrogenase expression protein HypF [Streptomyces meridianus]|uniref:Hydrogenase expression protein HypF n=1 Tax=Streptomyces meridianus TaxID=2938945 RepID=A0ABT0X6G1_9ACTN|nr:hydrogenase expression protein HypF [Streptomyces meridianus]MCM2578123.1 hydrogenase expression protein HypF [Streptomyces meridianus]
MLTRLQMPAGKAVALAAMPTAMLMGMGLTPQLAQADTQSKNGFKPGPCVSQPDEADEADAKAKAKEKAEEEKKAEESATDKDAEPKPSASADKSSADTQDDSAEAEAPSSSDSDSDAIDPLGVGSLLGGVLGGGEKESEAPEPEPEPKASESTKDSAADSVTDTVGKVTGSVSDTVKETTEKATDTVGRTTGGDDAGAEGYPCPEFDADLFDNAEYEDTSSRLPNQPWQLESSMLSLHGLDFKGIVKVRTHDGSLKKVLKFTAKGVDIKDLHQMVEGPGGTTMHVEARKGSTSTIRQGTVTMYTEELRGNLFGIIPIVFSPKMPPPLNIKEVFFTNAKVKQAGQFGGALTVPGIHSYGAPG